MTGKPIDAAELRGRVGQELGMSGWIDVGQARIDLFAEATMDYQPIHVDPAGARTAPFGGTIAHGFLVLALLSRMYYDAIPPIANADLHLNYGINRMRFLAPVRAGDRVRGRFVLRNATEKAGERLLLTYDVTVEIDGGPKPALVAEWLTLAVLRPAQGV